METRFVDTTPIKSTLSSYLTWIFRTWIWRFFIIWVASFSTKPSFFSSLPNNINTKLPTCQQNLLFARYFYYIADNAKLFMANFNVFAIPWITSLKQNVQFNINKRLELENMPTRMLTTFSFIDQKKALLMINTMMLLHYLWFFSAVVLLSLLVVPVCFLALFSFLSQHRTGHLFIWKRTAIKMHEAQNGKAASKWQVDQTCQLITRTFKLQAHVYISKVYIRILEIRISPEPNLKLPILSGN